MRFYGEMVSEPCGSDLCRFVFAPGKGGGIMSGILLALSLSLSLSLSSVLLMCCQVVLLLCVANVFLAGILLALSISFMCC